MEEVIKEFNLVWSRRLEIQFELLQWETNTFPSVGNDPQEIINRQIGDDYDIFLGIMWTKFGTPTARAGSGTEEEYRKAKKRYDANPDSLKIMFYFKDAPISPSSIDPAQLSKINSFKESLGEEG